MTAPPASNRWPTTPGRVAWLALFLAVWLIAGLSIVVGALDRGLTNDVAASPYHIPFYLCLAALAGVSIFLVIRATRQGRPWVQAFPAGYGSLGAGLLVILAWFIVDVGWREGVGIQSQGIETGIAPSRVILLVGVLLVLVAPLRAALQAGAGANRWPAVFSAALLVALVQPMGFHPAQSPWLEHARVVPNTDLWVMNADGSHQTRLLPATDPYVPWHASWSPDGREIAFTRAHVGAHSPVDDVADIWIVAADGSGMRPVAQGDTYKWLPHWSPDGTFIVYTDEPAGGPWATSVARPEGLGGFLGPGFVPRQRMPAREPAHIWRVRADGTGQPEQITNADANDRAATYSPDGAMLAFDSTRDSTRDDVITRVYVMNADGSNIRRLTDGADDWGATWSPDGNSIAYKSAFGPPGSPEQIMVMAADGRARRQVTSGPGGHTGPSWSPDGSHIAFDVSQDDKSSIWSVAVDGSDLRNLSDDPGAQPLLISGGDAWGKDGRIVYSRGLDPPASADPLVREVLGAAAMLFIAILVSLAAVIVRIGPPFGAFAVILGISTALIGGLNDELRFVPAAVVGGLFVDLFVRYTPPDQQAHVAGSGLAAAVVLGAGATVVLTTGLGWSPALLFGVAFAAGAIAWVVGGLVGGPRIEPERGLPA
jgi:Tol biopolymer transport system component